MTFHEDPRLETDLERTSLVSVAGSGRQGAARLVGYSVLYGAAGALGKALALLTVPVLTRLLEPEGYGLADLATSFAALASLIVTFAGDIPAARMSGRAQSAVGRKRVLTAYVAATAAISLLALVLLIPLSGFIASVLWTAPGEQSLALWTVALVPVSAIQVALVTIPRLVGRPWLFAILSTIDLLAQLGLAFLFVAVGLGPTGVVLGFLIGSGIGLLAALIAARSHLTVRFDLAVSGRIVRSGFQFLPSVTLFLLADYVSRLLLVTEEGPESVGYLAVAIRLASALTLLTGAFSLAWGPVALSLEANRRSAHVMIRVLTVFIVVGGGMAMILGATSPELIHVVSGAEYASASQVLPGLAIAAALAGALFVLVTAAGVTERASTVALSSALGAAAQVILTLALVPPLGLAGVGIGAVAGRGVAITALAFLLRTYAPKALQISVIAVSAGVAAAAGIQWMNASAAELIWPRALLVLIGSGLIGFTIRSSAIRTPGTG